MKEEPFNGYQKLIIALLALTQFSVVLDFMVLSPLGDLLIKSLRLSPSQFGMVVSVYSLSAGCAGFITAGFADSFDRKKLLVFFYVGFIIGTLFCGLSQTFYQLLLARMVTGFFGGVIGSVSMAIVSDLFSLKQRGRVMGFMQMGFGASQVLGIPISLFLAYQWNWKLPFLVIVVLAVCILALISIFIKPVAEHLKLERTDSAYAHLLKTLGNKEYRVGFLAAALLSLGGFLIMPWGSTFSINNLHITKDQLPVMFMIAGASTLISMPFIGKLSDRMNKFRLMWMATIWLMAVVVVYSNLVPSPFWLVIALNVMLMLGVMSRMVPAMALITSLPKAQDRGAFMSINSSLQYISGGIAAAIGGMIIEQKTANSPLEHFNLLGYLVVVVAAVCIFLVFRVSKIISQRTD
ncbi:MAG: hypothetical protein RIT43_502 [Bacteroidota bacterium]